MIRLVFTLSVTLGLLTPAAALAQTRPDFSGSWTLNFDKSGPGVAGNGAEVPFASEMLIAQSATELSVRRSSVRQATFAAVYKLDGSSVNVQAPPGITETAEARFDGPTLVITSHRSFPSPAGAVVTDFRELLTLTGGVLTVRKSMTQQGESQTETAIYDKTP